ncbi:MAG: GpE family phage tail protein [Desulfovibrio sp.]|nr:GpE family phage tail protein [Desulfovibrio sp.]
MFHWPPSELYALTAGDMVFWADEIRRLEKALKK